MKRLFAAAVAISALTWASPAPAAVNGALKFVGCYETYAPLSPGCTAAPGLTGLSYMALDDGGRNLYAAARLDSDGGTTAAGALVVFDRNPATGELTFRKCFAEPGTPACEAIGATQAESPLKNLNDVVVSHDGKHVYAVGSSGALVAFQRNLTSGALTYNGCLVSKALAATFPPAAACLETLDGLNDPGFVTISPDDAAVYVGNHATSRIGVFKRNPDGGLFGGLSQPAAPDGCIAQNGADDLGAAGGCRESRLIALPHDLEVAPGNAHLYVANVGSPGVVGNVAVLRRNASGGLEAPADLNAGRCVNTDGSAPLGSSAPCTALPTLGDVNNIALGPDGSRIYATARAFNNVVVLDRNPATGAIGGHSGGGCVTNVAGRPGCLFTDGIAEPYDVVLAGASLYVSALRNRSIVPLDVQPDGGLAPKAPPFGCVHAAPFPTCTLLHVNSQVEALAASPDGRSLYANMAGYLAGDQLLAYAIDRPPVCGPLAATTAFNTAITVNLACSDPDGDANRFEIVTEPAKGSLGAVQADGTVTYGPLVGSSGDDSFAFRALTPIVTKAAAAAVNLPSDPATFSISVQAGPPAVTPPPTPTPTPTPPPPQITSELSTNWNAGRRFTKVLKLVVRNVPAGASVQVLCRGGRKKGCPFKSRRVTVKRGVADVRARLKKARLKPGAKLEVRITKPGSVGKVVVYTILRRKLPSSRRLCLPPGAAKPQRC